MTIAHWTGFKVTLPSGHVEFTTDDELKRLSEIISPHIVPHHEPTVAAILRAVGEAFDVNEAQLRTRRKPECIVIPRMAAMALLNRHTSMSASGIARFFGLKSHGTASNAIERMAGERKELKPGHAAQWQRAGRLAEQYLKEVK